MQDKEDVVNVCQTRGNNVNQAQRGGDIRRERSFFGAISGMLVQFINDMRRLIREGDRRGKRDALK